MSTFTISIAVLLALSTMADASDRKDVTIYNLDEAPALFEQFIIEHKRVYKDAEDREIHYQAFKKNLASINEMNKKQSSAKFGMNKFADYTEEEKQSMRGLRTGKH